MSFIRPAFPFPPNVLFEAQTLDASSDTRKQLIQKLTAERYALQQQTESLESRLIALTAQEEISQIDIDFDSYLVTDDLLQKFIADIVPKIGLLVWNNNLDDAFAGTGESPGNVSGQPWALGVMLSDSDFLTPKICFNGTGGGWQWPTRRGLPLSMEELVKHFHIQFLSKDTLPLPRGSQLQVETSQQNSVENGRQKLEEIAVLGFNPANLNSAELVCVRTQAAQHLGQNALPISKKKESHRVQNNTSKGYIIIQNSAPGSEKVDSLCGLLSVDLKRAEEAEEADVSLPSERQPTSGHIIIAPKFNEAVDVGVKTDAASAIGPAFCKNIKLGSPVLNQSGEIIALYLGPSINHRYHRGITVNL